MFESEVHCAVSCNKHHTVHVRLAAIWVLVWTVGFAKDLRIVRTRALHVCVLVDGLAKPVPTTMMIAQKVWNCCTGYCIHIIDVLFLFETIEIQTCPLRSQVPWFAFTLSRSVRWRYLQRYQGWYFRRIYLRLHWFAYALLLFCSFYAMLNVL